MSIRETAKQHLESAEQFHRQGQADCLRAAVLEARIALECIAFGVFAKLRDKMDIETSHIWQPSKIFKEIAEVFPESTQSANISISDTTGETPPIEFEVWSLTPKQVDKFWHKLGRLVHPKGLSKDGLSVEFHTPDEIEKTLKETLPLIKRHLESQAYGLNMQINPLEIECGCGCKFVRETHNTSTDKPRKTQCPKCKLQYVLTPGDAQQLTRTFDCPHHGCGKANVVNNHFFELGGSFECKHCARSVWLKHGVTLVGDTNQLGTGAATVTFTSEKD